MRTVDRGQKAGGRLSWRGALVAAGVAVTVTVFVFPIYWMICTSLKGPLDILTRPPLWVFRPTLENYRFVFQSADFGAFLRNSLSISLISTVVVVVLGFAAAYSFARYAIGGGHLMFFILSTRMFPAIAVVIPYFVIFRTFGLLDTRTALVLTYAMFNLPFAIWLLHGFIKDVPLELEESARLDGCSRWRVMAKIVLPLLAPGIAVTVIFCLIFSWNEFLFAFLLTRSAATTVTVGVSAFWTQRGILWGPLSAAATVCIAPMLLFAVMLQRYIVRGLTFGAVRG